jgi:hypothetical protein
VCVENMTVQVESLEESMSRMSVQLNLTGLNWGKGSRE